MLKLNKKWPLLTAENRLHNVSVPIVALTGGMACGKSTVSNILRQMSFPIIDADQLVKTIYQKEEIFHHVKSNYPEAVRDGKIDFPQLRKIVFSDSSKLSSLENEIYRFMPAEFKLALSAFDQPNFIVYDVPLLFEKKLNTLIDLSVCVYSDYETQIQRIMVRDNSNRELAQKILSHQLNIEVKKNKSNLVIDNNSNLEQLKIQINLCVDKILER